MEKTLKSNNDKEFMRMAMLKHEETFREQVNELHRLYRIQKLLMENVGVNQQQQQQQQKQKSFTIDHYQQQLILQQAQVQAQRDINRSKSSNIMMGLNVIRPDNNHVLTGANDLNLRSSDNAQEHIAESNANNKLMMLDDTEIELTLSLGPSSFNPRRRKTGKSESGQSISSSSTGSSQTKKTSPKNDGNTTRSSTTTWGGFTQGSGIESRFSNGQQNSNNPSWLYQALSLKLT